MITETTINKVKELWPEDWQKILDYYKKKEEDFDNYPLYMQKNLIEKLGENHIEDELLKKIKRKEATIKYEQEVLNKIIPKDQLEDGEWYEGTGCNLSRYVKEARWSDKKQTFYYVRQKYGSTFEDTMDHFADTVDTGFAGFTPLKKINKYF